MADFLAALNGRRPGEHPIVRQLRDAGHGDLLNSGEVHRAKQPEYASAPLRVAAPGKNPVYVAAAIRSDLERLAAAAKGCRNDTLLRVACNVFEFVKGGHADQSTAVAELERIAGAVGLPHSEIHTTLRSAWQRTKARDVPAPGIVAPAYSIEGPQQ